MNSGAATTKHRATEADLLALPDDGRGWEMIDGELIEKGTSAHQWSAAGYVEVLVAQRGERVRAEPFQAIELSVGTLFGDDEESVP